MKDRKWCAVDAEGDVGNQGLIGIAVYSDQCNEWITDHHAMIDALDDHARSGYTFLCHNASYDIPVIWEQLGLRPEYTYYNGRLHHGTYRWHHRKPAAQIWDTLDLSGGLSLEVLGNAIGYPKLETPQRLKGIDPDRYQWRCERHGIGECVQCYAIRDAEIVYRFINGLTTLLAGWGVDPSARISAIALDTWKALDHPESIGLSDRHVRSLARRGYYGGRTECFQYGTISPCYVADVVSMYPSVMAEVPFPDPSTLVHLTNIPLSSLPLDCEGVAEVDISVPPQHVPPLPHTHRGERIYPVGRLVGTWTLLELRHAVSLGCRINHVYQVAYATSNLHPFRNFIGTIWAMRQAYKDSDDPRQLFAKLLLNNLYGRLGVRDHPERTIIKPAPSGWSSHKSRVSYDTTWVGETLYLSHSMPMTFKKSWSNVMWAAQITSAARVKLHKLMLLQGVYLAYCDTDSIFSTQPIQGIGEGLGQLKAEGDFQRAIIVQPKLYALQDLQGKWCPKAKGVPRNAALRFLQGHAIGYSKPVKPKEALIRGIAPGTWIPITKERRTDSYRRQPRNVLALSTPEGHSETDPLVHGPLTDYLRPTDS